MQASTISAVAGSVSATVAMISAVVAAISATNSYRSAKASGDALRETRVQRSIDHARTELRLLADISDAAAALVTALAQSAADRRAVEVPRAVLRRSAVVAGYESDRLRALLSATAPLSAADVAALEAEVAAAAAGWRQAIEAAQALVPRGD